MGRMSDWMAGGGRIAVAGQSVPAQVVAQPVDGRTYVITGIGHVSAPIITHPNDLRVRVPGTQPFDRAWQGFQKENALALLQYGSRHPGWGPDVPGTLPGESPYDRNTMQFLAARTATTQKDPARSAGAVGPGLSWLPNPTQPPAVSTAYQGESAPWWRTALRRLIPGAS